MTNFQLRKPHHFGRRGIHHDAVNQFRPTVRSECICQNHHQASRGITEHSTIQSTHSSIQSILSIKYEIMAGLGRRTHYRKHLTDSIIYDFPEPSENERIAKVVATRGSNQFDIVLAADKAKDQEDSSAPQESLLAILPTKFNKLVWVKRNDFVIVETGDAEDAAQEGGQSGGIRYIISHILYKDQVKHLQSKGLWPNHDAEFSTDKIGLRTKDVDDVKGDGATDAVEENQPKEEDDGIVYDMGYEDDDFLVNTNRLAALKVDDSSDSESSEE